MQGKLQAQPSPGEPALGMYRVRGPLRLPASSLSIPPKDRRSWQLGFVQGQKANQPAFHKARNEGRKSSSIGSLPYRGKCPETLFGGGSPSLSRLFKAHQLGAQGGLRGPGARRADGRTGTRSQLRRQDPRPAPPSRPCQQLPVRRANADTRVKHLHLSRNFPFSLETRFPGVRAPFRPEVSLS